MDTLSTSIAGEVEMRSITPVVRFGEDASALSRVRCGLECQEGQLDGCVFVQQSRLVGFFKAAFPGAEFAQTPSCRSSCRADTLRLFDVQDIRLEGESIRAGTSQPILCSASMNMEIQGRTDFLDAVEVTHEDVGGVPRTIFSAQKPTEQVSNR